METSKKDKKIEKVSEESTVTSKKETVKTKQPAKKEVVKTKQPAKKKPKFVIKEALILDGKECFFVEKLKGKVIVRFEDGTYKSAKEEDFSAK